MLCLLFVKRNIAGMPTKKNNPVVCNITHKNLKSIKSSDTEVISFTIITTLKTSAFSNLVVMPHSASVTPSKAQLHPGILPAMPE